MKLGIATDHNGVNEKKVLIEYLNSLGHSVIDYSPVNTDTDDYPDYAIIVSNNVVNKNVDLGILLCGTGIGMSIAANKVKGIRCAKVSSKEEAVLAREHNDANVIALSYKENVNALKEMIESFINATVSQEERHIRRRQKIHAIEGIEYEG